MIHLEVLWQLLPRQLLDMPEMSLGSQRKGCFQVFPACLKGHQASGLRAAQASASLHELLCVRVRAVWIRVCAVCGHHPIHWAPVSQLPNDIHEARGAPLQGDYISLPSGLLLRCPVAACGGRLCGHHPIVKGSASSMRASLNSAHNRVVSCHQAQQPCKDWLLVDGEVRSEAGPTQLQRQSLHRCLTGAAC